MKEEILTEKLPLPNIFVFSNSRKRFQQLNERKTNFLQFVS